MDCQEVTFRKEFYKRESRKLLPDPLFGVPLCAYKISQFLPFCNMEFCIKKQSSYCIKYRFPGKPRAFALTKPVKICYSRCDGRPFPGRPFAVLMPSRELAGSLEKAPLFPFFRKVFYETKFHAGFPSRISGSRPHISIRFRSQVPRR